MRQDQIVITRHPGRWEAIHEFIRTTRRFHRRHGRQGGWVQLIIFIIATLVSIALAPKPPKPRAASLEDFELPTAEEDRSIPVVFGEVEITGPNVIWFGHLDKKAIKKAGLFSSTTIGYKYYLSMHLALCYGPVDAITRITVDDHEWFAGERTTPGLVTATITGQEKLFGGKKAEGGVTGGWQFTFGAGDQAPLAYLEGEHALNAPQPAFRGVLCTLWENSTTTDAGYIGNTRYVKPWAFTVRRRSAGWDEGELWYEAKIAPTAKTMNPAHILYQCCTDSRFGMGRPTSSLDDAAWRKAADTLFDEGLGLRMLWNHSTSIEDFVSIVLDHIDGTFAFDPTTGKLVLKLIRADYDVEDLDVFDPSNIDSMDSFQRQVWGETVNELTVVYTDPGNNKKAAVTAHDLGNIRSQGLVHETVQLPGLFDVALAEKAAMRELQARSTPLAKVRFTTNRAAWKKVQSDVILLNWPERQVTGMVIRVLTARKGELRDGSIVIEGVQDIFSIDAPAYTTAQPVVPDETPPGIPDDQESTGGSVISTSMTAPPVSPVDGATYFVPPGATGAWSGHTGEAATWDEDAGEWDFETIPAGGVQVTDQSMGDIVTIQPDGSVGPAPWTPAIPPLTEGTPDSSTDFMVFYDTSASNFKKVKPEDLPSGGNTTATYITSDDETPDLPNSLRLVAGDNVTFDTTTPGELEISATGGGGGGGGKYLIPLTNGDVDAPELLFEDGDIVTAEADVFT